VKCEVPYLLATAHCGPWTGHKKMSSEPARDERRRDDRDRRKYSWPCFSCKKQRSTLQCHSFNTHDISQTGDRRSRSRDRDRDRHRRSRSRDRSRRSPSVSPERPRRKKPSNFSSVPPEGFVAPDAAMGMMAQMAALGGMMPMGAGAMPGMGAVPGMGMPAAAGGMPGMPPAMGMPSANGNLDQSTKTLREV